MQNINPSGAGLIAQERIRQIQEEGFTEQHDEGYIEEELVDAAHCYINAKRYREVYLQEDNIPLRWPWDEEYWHPSPSNRKRELVIAGALIAAEIDRILRIESKANSKLKIDGST